MLQARNIVNGDDTNEKIYSCEGFCKFGPLQSCISSFSSSNLYQLGFLKYSTLFTITNISDLPAIYSVFAKLCHHFFLFLGVDTDHQPSTCLSSISFPELKVHDFILDLNQTFINGQPIDHQLNIQLLCLPQIISMAKNSKARDISTGSSFILTQKISSNCAQSCHLLLSPEVCLDQLRFSSFLKDFITFLFTSLEPLHRIDCESNPKRFGKDDSISRISIVRHHKFFIFHYCDSAASHHWPLVVDCLTSANLSS